MPPPQTLYFISDLHVGQYLEDLENKKKYLLLLLFEEIRFKNADLVINGDLFDFWFDYKTVIPKRCFWLCYELQKLVNSGTKIHIIPGNHDYWMFTFFQEMGISIHHQALEIDLHNKRFFIAHGDGFAPKDHGYRVVKYVFRHPLSIWMYRWLHPDVGVWFAEKFSRSSRVYTTEREDSNPNLAPPVYTNVGHSILKKGYDVVVFGHTHKPELTRFEEGTYLNIGNWITDFSYGLLEDGELSLKYWPQTR